MSRLPRTHPARLWRSWQGAWLAGLVLLVLLLPVPWARADVGMVRDAGAADAALGPALPSRDAAVIHADAGTPRAPEPAQPSAPGPVEVPSAPAVRLGLPADAPLESSELAAGPKEHGATDLKYLLERVEVSGNRNTRERLIKTFVPLEIGSTFRVSDPELEAMRYRLLGTGWYDRVELRLKRGKRPGGVVLVIEVEERRTLVFQELALGLGWSVEGVKRNATPGDEPGRKAEPYLGLAIADTNFLGTGKTLGGELLLSPDQQGVALWYSDPVVRSSHWGFRTRATFVNGQEYFGGDDTEVSVSCPEDEDTTDRVKKACMTNALAVVADYWRAGLSLGTGRDVGSFTRLTLDWHGDFVRLPPWGRPDAATMQRGTTGDKQSQQAIDLAIEPGNSFVSMVSLGLTYDKRDSAILPSRGMLASFLGDLSSPLIGSDYQFVRLQTSLHGWFPLKWGHTIRTGLYAGAVFGYAPFFYKFFVTDLTDLQPSRILGLNLDHRPAPNMFGFFQCGEVFSSKCGTAVAQMRQEELAARVDVEYIWPLVRGRHKFLKGADAFFLLGLYALADPDDLQLAIPGYDGIARVPIDLTFDAGVRLDTQIGVFQIGLGKLLFLAN
jgi:outer membrane protein insertion porin family